MDLRRQQTRSAPPSADQIRDDDTLHRAALLFAGGYAWQLHGFFVSIAVIASLVVSISLTNAFLVGSGRDRLIRRSRWLWIAAAFVLIGLSGVSIGTASH